MKGSKGAYEPLNSRGVSVATEHRACAATCTIGLTRQLRWAGVAALRRSSLTRCAAASEWVGRAPNGSRLSCGRSARGRKESERQTKRLASEATQLLPTCERPPASSAC